MPTILMACTHPYWSCLQVGSQHLARQFADQGWDVVYLSAPITALHLSRLACPEVRTRFKRAIAEPSIHQNSRIRAYTPFSLIAPDGRFVLRDPLVTRNWYQTIIPSMQKILARAGAERVTLLYIDNISYHFLLNYVQHDTSVFRVMDMHDHFPGWRGRAKQLAQKIAPKVDLAVYSAQGLEPYVASLSPRQTFLVPNGVDFEFFQSEKRAHTSPHPLLKKISGPIVLYAGMLDSRLDWGLISHAASTLPEVSFVLAGPATVEFKAWTWPENVHFIGSIPHQELPQLMASATAGIIPFDVQGRIDLIQGIRPLKLLEYMATGLPVVCARWAEVENMHSPAWLYESWEEFVELVDRVVHTEYDPQPSIAFARANDWTRTYTLLMRALPDLPTTKI